MLKSQNISHALCAHFSWLRTGRWDGKVANGYVQNLMPRHYQIANNQKETRRRMARERRGAGSSLVSMETPY